MTILELKKMMMKAKKEDKTKASALMMLVDNAQKLAKEKGEEVSEKHIIDAAKKLAKMAKESIDAGEFNEEDEKILNLIDKNAIIVINKIDKNVKIDLEKFKNFKVVQISAKEDISPLIKELEKRLDSFSGEDEHILISTRQINAVEKALNAINESKEFLKTEELELFSYQIQDAIRAISEITKPFEYDEMLDKMFGSFCVGK